jgi:putative ABC transport system substrate-binding protein
MNVRRREFITLLGGAAAYPLAAHAQQPAMPVIGFLSPTSLETIDDNLRAFRQGLKEAGYIEGENITIIHRFAENQIDRLPALAAELVRRKAAVIATHSTGAAAAKAATKTIPVVFAVAEDPVRIGLVASLARTGNNLTGANFVNAELVAKRMELLRELVPTAARVALLVNPGFATRAESMFRDVQAAASVLGLQVQAFNVSTSLDINAAFASMAQQRPDALFIGADIFFASRRVQLVQLAARHAIPAVYPQRYYPDIGGLMSCGADAKQAFRQVGAYTGRILKGAKPTDLPVVQSNKFELVINAETARMLGITVPSSMLTSADEVIE